MSWCVLSFTFSVKRYCLITCACVITKPKAICQLLREGIQERPEDIIKKEPSCPTVLEIFTRIVGICFNLFAGIVLILVHTIIIVIMLLLQKRKTCWPFKQLKQKGHKNYHYSWTTSEFRSFTTFYKNSCQKISW